MDLHYKAITVKNFLSYGNQPTRIEFDKVPSTLLIAPNGSGKSAALLDSVFFAHFGEAFRAIKKAQIPNNINNKDALTVLEYTLDGTEWVINRGIKPDVFTVHKNGEEVWQDHRPSDKQKELMATFGLDAAALKNLILISESNTPFMRLSGPERREFVERVLNLGIFAKVHEQVKKSIKTLKDPYARVKSSIDAKQEVINRLNKIIENSDSPDQSLIDECETKIRKIDEFLAKAEPALVEINGKIAALDRELRDAQMSENNARAQHRIAVEARKKFEDGKCPTCGGEIHGDKIECFESDIESAWKLVEENSLESTRVESLIAPLKEKQTKGQSKISELKSQKWELDSTLTKERSKKVANVDDELKEASEELAELLDEFADMKEDYEDLAELDKVLKSGQAKLPIISEYIPFFNKKINEYLEMFGLQIWFELDSEFNETIRARYKDAFTYESFSTGQQERINFAILLTWRDIASKLSSVKTNLLIVDEFAAKLDDNGFAVISKALGDLENTNVFCIAPKEVPDSSGFDRRLKITTNAGFSILEEV
ncbi:recombination endonuclease subunit [Sinorhizobium phage phiM9]|uniref:Recombination endonuclease subunit n=1 Tax=Sinorhizobium phage phiM9 TaxID=1636182 RepID=A0A0F6TH90_9CAUD|nr:recombination endonuclease subunit [Sinorhizobium phage phiM9]AKE44879.1 recombination endonuclease subunit [Sinorhizobium phage phiM9]